MFYQKCSVLTRFRYWNSHFKSRKMSNIISPGKPILYVDEASPPARFVMITARLLDMDIHLHHIDLFKNENKSEFYTKINPLQKVPALAINGHTICDSHAIAIYLCRNTKYQDLYPEDSLLRAKVDQLLYFNASTFFIIDSDILTEYFAGKWPADKTKVVKWYNAIDHLEMHLSGNKWLTGDKMRLCDVCCAMTLSSLGILFPPLDRHIKVKEWMERLERLSCFDINKRGIERLRFFIKQVADG